MARQEWRITFRRAYFLEWTSKNPVLLLGEPGYEIDTGRMKIGDGITLYNDLSYFDPGSATEITLLEHIESTHPHSVYDDGPSLALLYENKKV